MLDYEVIKEIQATLPENHVWKFESLLVKDFYTVVLFLSGWTKEDLPDIKQHNIDNLLENQAAFINFHSKTTDPVYITTERIF